MDSPITAVARALAAGDPIGALKQVRPVRRRAAPCASRHRAIGWGTAIAVRRVRVRGSSRAAGPRGRALPGSAFASRGRVIDRRVRRDAEAEENSSASASLRTLRSLTRLRVVPAAARRPGDIAPFMQTSTGGRASPRWMSWSNRPLDFLKIPNIIRRIHADVSIRRVHCTPLTTTATLSRRMLAAMRYTRFGACVPAPAGSQIVGMPCLQARPLGDGASVVTVVVPAFRPLRPAGRRLLPPLLPPVDGQVEQRVAIAHRLDAATRRPVSLEDIGSLSQVANDVHPADPASNQEGLQRVPAGPSTKAPPSP